jgi:hypothetical protein
VQSEIEMVRQLQAGRPYVDVMADLSKLQARLEAKSHSITRFFYLISLTSLPNFTKAVKTAALVETKRRLAITAIAVRRYELKHGQPPQTLAALVPEFLPSVPLDWRGGETLKYRAGAGGKLMLYSVGIDGRDDGGDYRPATTGAKTGLCEGPDAVWPMAVQRSQPRLSAQATP